MSEINVGDVIARLRVDSSQFDSALRAAQERVRGLSDEVGKQRQAVEQSGNAWRSVLQIAGGLGIATSISAATSAMLAFAHSVVETGARMQQLQVSLNAVSGSAASGAASFQFITDTANKYGFSIANVAQSYTQLMAAARGTSLEGEKTRQVFEAVTAAARTFGSSQQQVSYALLALQQMVSKGTVSMEELRRQLGDALPGAVQIAARAMGVSTAALEEMVRKGEVLSADFLPKFARQLREEMGQGAVNAAQTAQAAFARLENEWMLLKDRIAKAGPLQLVVNIVGSFTEMLRAGREETEAAQARLQRLTVAPVDIGRGRQRPGTLQGATQEELEQLRKFSMMANDVADASARDLIARITRRAIEAQGVAARTAGLAGEDPLRAQAEAARVAEERTKALTDKLNELRKSLGNIAEMGKTLPNTFGTMTGTADQQVEALDRKIKDLTESLQKLTPADLQDPSVRQRAHEMDVELGKAQAQRDALIKSEREAESARKKAAREAIQDQEEYQRAIDKVTMALANEEDRAVKALETITARYTQTKEERAEEVITRLTARFPESTRVQEAAALAQQAVEYQTIVNALKEEYTALQQRATALSEADKAQKEFNLTLQTTLEKLQVPREERTEVTLRARAQAMGLQLTAGQEQQLRLITAQERFNTVWKVTENLVTTTAGHMQMALTGLITGTQRVGDAFRQMAASIIASARDILLNEMFKRLLSLGLSVLRNVLTRTVIPQGTFSNPEGFEVMMPAQQGLVVNRPTRVLAGENPAMNPEYILNRVQMNALLRAAPSAGGQAMGGVTIINFTESQRALAEQRAADERAAGHQVVLNAILGDIGRGESSQVVRALRAMQR